MFVKEMVIQ